MRIRQAKSVHGFTLVELLVVIAVIAILVLLLLPAINAARESARLSVCKNNLRNLGVALHNHHGARKRFPAGWVSHDPAEADGEPGWAWGVELLPFLEEQTLYDRGFDLRLSIDDPRNQSARETVLPVFLCPTDPSPNIFPLPEGGDHDHDHDHDDDDDHAHDDDHDHEHEDVFGHDLPVLFDVSRSNYVGVHGTEEVHDHPGDGDGVFFLNSKLRVRDVTDGLSKTIFVGERSSKLGYSTWVGVPEGALANMERVVGATDHTPNSPEHHFDDFGSHHPTGAHFLLGDGAVLLLTDRVDPTVYKALATRSGYEEVPDGFGD